MAIKAGSIVRLSETFCESIEADSSTIDSLGVVREIIRGSGIHRGMTRAKVQWDDGVICGVFVRNLEEYRGVVPLATREEWGLA